jgi:hypothetical protein
MKINLNVYPSGSGGYVFKDADGTLFRGKSWQGLASRLTRYRQTNRLPIGDPLTEVLAQACARNPTLCQDNAKAATPPPRPASLKGRVLGWLSSLKKASEQQPLAFVDEHNMRARAATCAACPRNAALPDGCSSCRLAVAELRRQVIGPQRVAGRDQRLNACSELGCDLPTAAWLNEPRVHSAGLPPACWRKAGV